jgi:hypothetical protein
MLGGNEEIEKVSLMKKMFGCGLDSAGFRQSPLDNINTLMTLWYA